MIRLYYLNESTTTVLLRLTAMDNGKCIMFFCKGPKAGPGSATARAQAAGPGGGQSRQTREKSVCLVWHIRIAYLHLDYSRDPSCGSCCRHQPLPSAEALPGPAPGTSCSGCPAKKCTSRFS